MVPDEEIDEEIAEAREEEREQCVRLVESALPEILKRRGLASGTVARHAAEEMASALREMGK